ncbi:DoxX family membrane protein [Streptomyces sp. NPDC060198]|uniref:DoxX family membrane protein n=1 Tax=Streptomyces sp. NPDC060198 TaxID=3347070 RepID=UPI003657C7A9
MSVDTRTPRFDDQPALSMTKVDSDPAQVIVNHASFRVQLPPGQRARLRGAPPVGAARVPAMSGAGGRRRAPVVWSGRSEPGDPGASGLLQAVRNSSTGHLDGRTATGATRLVPHLDETQPNPVLPSSRRTGGPLLPPMRKAVGAYDGTGPAYDGASSGYDGAFDRYDEKFGDGRFGDDRFEDDPDEDPEVRDRRTAGDSVRHAYYPGRRMNLGVVLFPLRVFLGFISIYAGMGKLSDPVFFDGGERGSMVKWLNSLHPWEAAEPLRDAALTHPVGAGLTVAFLQVVVGVLTVLGLWQRVAAAFGALLSAALLVTVSWHTVAVFDAPDIIFLAAWSPLVIAGAPVYSVDARLAGEAWRRLGPRSGIWDLRSRVLRRGSVLASVVVGLTLLVGSVLGGAVRSTQVVTVPGPNEKPTNQLPGVPLPEETPEKPKVPKKPVRENTPVPSRSVAPATPSAERTSPSSGATAGEASTGTGAEPSATQGTVQQPSRQETPPQAPPSTSAGPSSSGSTTGGGDGGGATGGDSSDPSDGDSGAGDSTSGGGRNPLGGLLG